MSDYLPDVPHSGEVEVSKANAGRASRELRRAEFDLFRYRLKAAVAKEKDIADTDALEDVLTEATDAELRFLHDFLIKANGSDTARELIARKLAIFSDANNRRIQRRFGR